MKHRRDLMRAFETVYKKRLLKELYKMGIRGILLAWLKSYLYSRKQYVKMNGACSELLDVKYGVPQGSKLDPLIFIFA